MSRDGCSEVVDEEESEREEEEEEEPSDLCKLGEGLELAVLTRMRYEK
jgi:hypothetical protein